MGSASDCTRRARSPAARAGGTAASPSAAALPAYDEGRATLGAGPARELWRLTERALDRLAALGRRRPSGAWAACVSPRTRPSASELERELDALRSDGFAAEWVEPLPVALDRAVTSARSSIRATARSILRAGCAGSRRRPRRLGRRSSRAHRDRRLARGARRGRRRPGRRRPDGDARARAGAARPPAARPGARHRAARRAAVRAAALRAPRLRLLAAARRRPAGRRRQTRLEPRDRGDRGRGDDALRPGAARRARRRAGRARSRRSRIAGRGSGVETPDRLPLAGPVPGRTGVWIAGGYSGHGNVLGFACGELVARAIAGREPARARALRSRALLLDP